MRYTTAGFFGAACLLVAGSAAADINTYPTRDGRMLTVITMGNMADYSIDGKVVGHSTRLGNFITFYDAAGTVLGNGVEVGEFMQFIKSPQAERPKMFNAPRNKTEDELFPDPR